MKSLRSIAQQKNFDINKLEQVVSEMNDLSPIKMGSILFYSADDTNAIIYAYYERFNPKG